MYLIVLLLGHELVAFWRNANKRALGFGVEKRMNDSDPDGGLELGGQDQEDTSLTNFDGIESPDQPVYRMRSRFYVFKVFLHKLRPSELISNPRIRKVVIAMVLMLIIACTGVFSFLVLWKQAPPENLVIFLS